jgi:hypothetical protein
LSLIGADTVGIPAPPSPAADRHSQNPLPLAERIQDLGADPPLDGAQLLNPRHEHRDHTGLDGLTL